MILLRAYDKQQGVLPGAIKRKRGDCYPIFAFLLCFALVL
jgi:hypothetical protein